MNHPSRRLLFPPMAALCLTACDSSPPDPAAAFTDFGDPWTTEPEFEFGERIDGDADANFAIVSAVKVLGSGDRILVVEPRIFRATIWTLDGSLIREVGRAGEAPGEFSGGFSVRVDQAGFYVMDLQRFTSYSSDGDLVGTIPLPPRSLGFRGFGFRPEALLADGSVLAQPRVPPAAMIGFGGYDPIREIPISRLRNDDGQWHMDRIAGLDVRNRNLTIIPEGSSMYDRGINSEQLLGDFDLTWFDPVMGSVVVLRRNLGGGQVELVEIEANGDTAWHRRLAPPPVRMDSEQISSFIDRIARQLTVARGSSDGQDQAYRAMRAAVREALYIPDPLPGARRVLGTSSGDVWLQGFEEQDSLSVWYSVPRGRQDSGVRKVLLPPGFRATDATDTHVWGVRQDELGTQYVVGRRLVPPQGVPTPVSESEPGLPVRLRGTAGRVPPPP